MPTHTAPLPDLSTLFSSGAPAFERRGYMLDVSRCRVPTMDTLRELVGLLAALRFNELQLYTEHTFAYSGHEVVWRDASPLTPDEVRTLDGWCTAAGIELVPNQNSLGHCEHWLRHAPYAALAEAPGGFTTPWGEFRARPSTLRPGPEAETLLADLYAQLLPCFRSRNFNVGCDEPFELGQGASRDVVARRGRAAVFLDHLEAVHRLAASHGRTIQFWADVLFEREATAADLARVPADATALIWGYEAGHPFEAHCAAVAATGRRFYVCPGDSTWCSLGGRLHTARANITEASAIGRAHGAAGLLLTHWGDFGHWQPPVSALPGLILAATAAWNGTPCDDPTLIATLDRLAGDVGDGFGATLVAVGQLDTLHGHNPANRSLLWEALFKAPDWLRLRDRLLAVPPEAWAAVSTRRDELAAQLDSAHASSGALSHSARLLRDELRFSLDLVSAALARAGELMGYATASDWRQYSPHLLAEHRRLWQARSRPGGLDESCDYLARVV